VSLRTPCGGARAARTGGAPPIRHPACLGADGSDDFHMIDIHCHILPGIDDGSPDLQTTIKMARAAEADGIEAIIATPHANLTRGRPTPDAIRDLTAQVNEALSREGINVTVFPGAEIALSDDLQQQIEAGSVLTLADRGTHVLIELPFTGFPTFVPSLFFNIQLLGFTPIIAHPERSAAARIDLELVIGLAHRGAQLQINAESIAGREGRVIRKITQTLMRKDLVHYIASDGHGARHRPPRMGYARKSLRRLGGDHKFAELTFHNPYALLRPTERGRLTADKSSAQSPRP